MRVRGLGLVREALGRGAVIWTEGVPRLRLSPDPETQRAVREDRQTIEAVMRRAAAFAQQLQEPSPDPFLRFRDPKWCAGGCPSCGVPVPEHQWLRCDLCAAAAELVLHADPAVGPSAQREP